MKQKNIMTVVTAIIIALETVGILAQGHNLNERWNDAGCIQAAREIGETVNAKTVVVLKQKSRVLAGILPNGGEIGEIINIAESILREEFGKNAKIMVEAENKQAADILELGCFVDTELQKEIVEARFEHLWKVAAVNAI